MPTSYLKRKLLPSLSFSSEFSPSDVFANGSCLELASVKPKGYIALFISFSYFRVNTLSVVLISTPRFPSVSPSSVQRKSAYKDANNSSGNVLVWVNTKK